MANSLAQETSPYLLQHAENPVAWLPWGEAAFARARAEDKPVFLSIGYAACHWCHVMAHESFEDPQVAVILNEGFICVKVDREERPDVDSLYMDAVVALTGHGGWPMSVFLTPDGKPFYGGTYFPPQARHGLPSFRDVLQGVSRAWKEQRADLAESANRLSLHLESSQGISGSQGGLDEAVLDRAAQTLFQSYDWTHGGWGQAPKFPQPMAIEVLLRRFVRRRDTLARDMALHALRAMARGGIHDQIGGGFHRYSVDARWLVPHFEKMLYDNALLAPAYLHAWQITGDPDLLATAHATLRFLLSDMRVGSAGFASSLDADTDGEEGRTYVWEFGEAVEALVDPALVEAAKATFGLTPEGNFEGRNILYRSTQRWAVDSRSEPEAAFQVDAVRSLLLAARRRRASPGRDDKVLTVWNGLALHALAEAARATGDPEYRQAAPQLAAFLLDHLRTPDGLMRSWRQGQARQRAFLEDHAALGLGMLSTYQLDFDPRWYAGAVLEADEILEGFSDPQGGFFDTSVRHEPLLTRPKALQDSPVPSGNTLAVSLLLQLEAFTGKARYGDPARKALSAVLGAAGQHPTAFAGWLCVLDLALGSPLQLAIVGADGDPARERLLRVAWDGYKPNLVVSAGTPEHGPHPELLAYRTPIDGQPTAYVCRHFACNLPTTDPAELRRQLEEAMGKGASG